MSDRIPFNFPSVVGAELDYVQQSLTSGHLSGDGAFSKRCHALLETELQVNKALLTTSCTHALEMSAILLDLQPGDEVIMPSFTFVSTANAYVLRGARPVFVDVRSDTLNIDETQIEAKITPRTRAIVVVHYAGVGCEMDAIMAIAKRHNLTVIEDNAHGLFGKYRGRWLGTLGAMATLSFHETKNFVCGEGGALLINDPALVQRAEIIREKGTNRSRFFRGEIDKYSWVDIGSSYLMSDLSAAFLYGQLECRTAVQTRRAEIWEQYDEGLRAWADARDVRLPFVPDDRDQSYHMFYLLFPDLETRTRFIAHLSAHGVHSVFHYLPLHLSDMGMQFGGQKGDCPVTESVSDQLVRLPFFYALSQAQQAYIIDQIIDFPG
jgi:dTDP-4-amino-4,6-dideoxygalactose transaminase